MTKEINNPSQRKSYCKIFIKHIPFISIIVLGLITAGCFSRRTEVLVPEKVVVVPEREVITKHSY